MVIELPNNWNPRPYQMPLWLALEGGCKRAVAVWHRRSGKDDIALHWTATQAIQKPGTYWHLLPQANQARKAMWDAVDPHTGKRRIDIAFPVELRETTREQDMLIRFKNGATWQVVGSDNYNALVGSPPIGIVYSEYMLSDPNAWGLLRPILLENGGWALFNGTPRGRNHLHAIYELGQREPGWFSQILTVEDTHCFTPEQINAERRQIASERGDDEADNLVRQEYYCSWDAAIPGSYYGRQIAQAETGNRIGDVPHDGRFPVITAWDLGVGDSTAIWFIQQIGYDLRIIDYYESSGVGADHYARLLKTKDYTYDYHILPHDADDREWGNNATSRVDVLKSLGIKPLRVLKRASIDDGINAVRVILGRCKFDKTRCERGLSALRQYQRRYDDKLKTFSAAPLHDWTSHACLIAGSQVLTHTGMRCIEDIEVGDSVWTPRGYSLVLNAGPVKRAYDLLAVNGLVCTPEHKVLTNRGFVEADALRYSDRIYSGSEWQCILISWFSKALNTGFRETITGDINGPRAAFQTCTEPSGLMPMGRYRRDFMSIIVTAMRSTMNWLTSNVFMDQITSASTPLISSNGAYLNLHQPTHYGRPLNGMPRSRGVSGIESMGKKCGRIENGFRSIAKAAASHFARLILRAPSSATSIARCKSYEGGGAGQWVYDLTVKNHACYQANGLLVSNSDAFRYLAQGIKDAPTSQLARPEMTLT